MTIETDAPLAEGPYSSPSKPAIEKQRSRAESKEKGLNVRKSFSAIDDTPKSPLKRREPVQPEIPMMKLDSSSALFAQHFGIIREMKSYCQDFKEAVSRQDSEEEIYKSFDNISRILETACQFLSFPVQI